MPYLGLLAPPFFGVAPPKWGGQTKKWGGQKNFFRRYAPVIFLAPPLSKPWRCPCPVSLIFSLQANHTIPIYSFYAENSLCCYDLSLPLYIPWRKCLRLIEERRIKTYIMSLRSSVHWSVTNQALHNFRCTFVCHVRA